MITKDSQSGYLVRILHLLWGIDTQYKEGRSVAETPIHSVLVRTYPNLLLGTVHME